MRRYLQIVGVLSLATFCGALCATSASAGASKGQTIFVGNGTTPNVLAFSTTNEGDPHPFAIIEGSNTSLAVPFSVAVEPSGNLLVCTSPEIARFVPRASGNETRD
jgi:hypothetical protein